MAEQVGHDGHCPAAVDEIVEEQPGPGGWRGGEAIGPVDVVDLEDAVVHRRLRFGGPGEGDEVDGGDVERRGQTLGGIGHELGPAI